MIYQYSLLHLLFVAVLTLLWRMIDKKFDYKNYLMVALVVGWVGTFGYDILGVVVYRFWGYYSSNPLEYLAIAASTYVIAAPLFIETLGFLLEKLSRYKVGIRLFPGRVASLVLAAVSAVVVLGFTLLRFFEVVTPSWGYFAVMFLAAVTLLDQLVFVIRGVKGPVSLMFEGRILSIFAVPVSGLICGFLWELLNLQFPLWFQQNLPPEKVFGVPLVVILFWGMLNMGYWALANLLFPHLKERQ